MNELERFLDSYPDSPIHTKKSTILKLAKTELDALSRQHERELVEEYGRGYRLGSLEQLSNRAEAIIRLGDKLTNNQEGEK